MKRLKAYQVSDGNDQTVIRFATNSATARREGAGEMEVDWSEVDYCTRASQYDEFAPGPVPPLVRIQYGWWFECSCCGAKVDEYGSSRDYDEEEERVSGKTVADGQFVYCDETCRQTEYAERRARRAGEAALLEVCDAKFSGAKAVHVYASLEGQRLEAGTQFGQGRYGSSASAVHFTFPGGLGTAVWVLGDNDAGIQARDHEAWRAWRDNQASTAEAT